MKNENGVPAGLKSFEGVQEKSNFAWLFFLKTVNEIK